MFTVFRYRRKPGDESLPPQTHGNNLVEVIWTAIPTAIVLFLFVLSWQTLNTVERRHAQRGQRPGRRRALPVAVRLPRRRRQRRCSRQALPVGEDGGLVLPGGRAGAHHAAQPGRDPRLLRAQVPVQAGRRCRARRTAFDFTVEEPGTYRGQCAELCGTYHGSMLFEVHALPKAEFDAWLAGAIEKANATPGARCPRATPPARWSRPPPRTSRSPPRSSPPRRTPRSRSTSRTRIRPACPHNVEIKDASGAEVFKGDIIDGGKEINYAGPGARRRLLPLRLHGPSEHDRHAHGPVREHAGMATTTLNPAAPAVRGGLYEWLTTTDHKKIGIMYLINSILFFLAGGILALVVRAGARRPRPAARGRGVLQPGVHDARLVHAVPVRDPDPGGLRQLRRAAPDRRAGHGVPADQRPLLLAAAARRRADGVGLPRLGRRGGVGLDGVPAALGRRSTAAPARTCGSWA